jgi:hypothetical protein
MIPMPLSDCQKTGIIASIQRVLRRSLIIDFAPQICRKPPLFVRRLFILINVPTLRLSKKVSSSISRSINYNGLKREGTAV